MNLFYSLSNGLKTICFFFNSDYFIHIGGYPIFSKCSEMIVPSISYDQDDFTWCIKAAGHYPIFMNLILIQPLAFWIIEVLNILVIGTIIYIYIPLDVEDKFRNNRDWHYSVFLIVLPANIGIPRRYSPRLNRMRCYYAFVPLFSVVFYSVFTNLLFHSMKIPRPKYQIKSTNEILDNDFRLMGSRDVFNIIKQNTMARISFIVFFVYFCI